jgi:flagellin
MRINTNVSAINAQRNLWGTQRSIESSMAKLSSGFRINRAGDDAAGLAIANKLRADTKSLEQAARNAEQANSLVQIMEGATSNIQKMLDRMKELATQASSDTVNTEARTSLNAEFSQLVAEIDRTVDTTKFQGNKLINGGMGSTLDTNTANTTSLNGATVVNKISLSGTYGATTGTTYTLNNATAGTLTLTDGTRTQTVAVGSNGRQTVSFSEFGISVELENSYNAAATNIVGGTTASTGAIVVTGSTVNNGSFLVSSSGDYGVSGSDRVFIDNVDLRASTLGVSTSLLDTLSNAATALSAIDSAIAKVSTALGQIGAKQNRIEYALSNTKTAIQNLSAAESVIRDVDMAEEMTKFSKSQILSQAGTAMLAQANQNSQGILQLLRG